jgi:hypothetical protein
MRRALVLTDDAKRHPFRAGLPPHVTDDKPPVHRLGLTGKDWRDFLVAYSGCFAAVITFLS